MICSSEMKLFNFCSLLILAILSLTLCYFGMGVIVLQWVRSRGGFVLSVLSSVEEFKWFAAL